MQASRFVAMAAVCIICWNVSDAHDRLDESKAVAKVELLGGKVTRDDTLPSHPVIGVDFTGSKKFSDKYLHVLNSFSSLTSLGLNDCRQITDAGLDQLCNLKNLAVLDVRGTDITAAGRNLIWESLPKLQTVDESKAVKKIKAVGGNFVRNIGLSNSPVTEIILTRSKTTDEDLKELLALRSVTALTLDAVEITDSGLDTVVGFTNLRRLSLQQTKITDLGLRKLVGLKNLTSLSLLQCGVSNGGMSELSALKNLTEVAVSGQQLTDVGLLELTQLRNLSTLVFVDAQITDAGIKELHTLKYLTELNINRTKVTNTCMKEISKLNLTMLNLGETQITDVGLKELSGQKRLQRLYLGGTQITNAGVNELRRSLPHVQILH